MRTEFSETQLQNPQIARANDILRSCVHCGLCTATCPTYQLLGDELDGPRGRIYLVKDMLEKDRPADAKTVKHIDRCLSCLACMTTCPSGVHYMHLIDYARTHIAKTYKRPLFERLLRKMLTFILPHPWRFRVALKFAHLVRPFMRAFPDARIRAMSALVAEASLRRKRRKKSRGSVASAIQGERQPYATICGAPIKKRVALMTGCIQQVLAQEINDATIRLLTRLGCEVVVAPKQGCCGALVHHMGEEKKAQKSALNNIEAWKNADKQKTLDAILVNISGCGTVVKDYWHTLGNTPSRADGEWASRITQDISEFLGENCRLENVRPIPKLRVAYHAPCSLQHGQKITDAPKKLLQGAGFELLAPPQEAHLCCGSAGTYNLLQPALADALKARKCAALKALCPDVIATGNIGCMMQIASGLDTPVVHIVELLEWATGGAPPPALESAQRSVSA